METEKLLALWVKVIVFHATFNNISVISWFGTCASI